ncbi:hypothetical protein ACQ4PT_057466 [Festuca glaucescens]
MYVFRNGASLHVEEWRQVCSAVNGHRVAAEGRFSRNLDQCQKRVYTLKDRYKKELAKGRPTPGWLHFAQLRAFLADPHDLPPPGFAAKIPAASVVKEEVEEIEEEEASGGASGSIGRKTVPSKRRFSSLQDILDRSGGPPPGFPPDPPRMPATAKKAKEEEVGEEGSAHGAASADCLPGAVVTKLAEVYWSVEMERLSVEKEKMAMERERRAAKVEAENQGETDDN